jgi:cyclophilin family peptidyl-prolyl cis-trans isomerase
VHNLAPEFNDTKHVKGIVSMARGDAPDSATTSFFIVTRRERAGRRLHGVRRVVTGWQRWRDRGVAEDR